MVPLLLCLALAADTRPEPGPIRVLIIDGQNNHNWRATTPVLLAHLNATKLFAVDVSSHLKKGDTPGSVKTVPFPPKLEDYTVVVSNYNGAPWPKAFNEELEKRVKEGKLHLVIVHAANNSFSDWKEYNEMIGMGWRGAGFGDRLTFSAEGKEVREPKGKGRGAGHGNKHAFQVVIRDAEHPVTKGMPREWMHTADELYAGMRGPIKNVKVLATAYSDKDPKKDGKGGSGEHEPMIWTVTYGKGRVFHTPMGHDLDGMRCVGFTATLQRGTEWAATGKVTQKLPEAFPTKDKASAIPGGARRGGPEG
jgi:type 1 glutamine amidotransferase